MELDTESSIFYLFFLTLTIFFFDLDDYTDTVSKSFFY